MGEIAKTSLEELSLRLTPDRPDPPQGEWETTPDQPRTGPCGPRTGCGFAIENARLRVENARLRARIARLEAPSLAPLLDLYMGATFRACDVIAEAQRQAREAEDEGRAIPELPAALSVAGIGNARSLAKWLPDNGFEIVAYSGGSGIWAAKSPNII